MIEDDGSDIGATIRDWMSRSEPEKDWFFKTFSSRWYQMAVRHKKIAEHIYEDIRSTEVFNSKYFDDMVAGTATMAVSVFMDYDYFMHCGYSIENLLKGIIVRKNTEVINSKSRLEFDRTVMSHDLRALFIEAGMPYPEEYKLYLKRWEDCVLWKAKYPSTKRQSDDNSYADAYDTREMVVAFTDIFDALSKELMKGWTTGPPK
jgi:hypothetical protein